MGQLTANLPAVSDPDTTNSVSVSLSESDGAFPALTASQADNFQSLILVDQELIAYSTATLTSSNNYTLSGYLRRGVYGTPITPHVTVSRGGVDGSDKLPIPERGYWEDFAF